MRVRFFLPIIRVQTRTEARQEHTTDIVGLGKRFEDVNRSLRFFDTFCDGVCGYFCVTSTDILVV